MSVCPSVDLFWANFLIFFCSIRPLRFKLLLSLEMEAKQEKEKEKETEAEAEEEEEKEVEKEKLQQLVPFPEMMR